MQNKGLPNLSGAVLKNSIYNHIQATSTEMLNIRKEKVGYRKRNLFLEPVTNGSISNIFSASVCCLGCRDVERYVGSAKYAQPF